jgi:hypothetical protein
MAFGSQIIISEFAPGPLGIRGTTFLLKKLDLEADKPKARLKPEQGFADWGSPLNKTELHRKKD